MNIKQIRKIKALLCSGDDEMRKLGVHAFNEGKTSYRDYFKLKRELGGETASVSHEYMWGDPYSNKYTLFAAIRDIEEDYLKKSKDKYNRLKK